MTRRAHRDRRCRRWTNWPRGMTSCRWRPGSRTPCTNQGVGLTGSAPDDVNGARRRAGNPYGQDGPVRVISVCGVQAVSHTRHGENHRANTLRTFFSCMVNSSLCYLFVRLVGARSYGPETVNSACRTASCRPRCRWRLSHRSRCRWLSALPVEETSSVTARAGWGGRAQDLVALNRSGILRRRQPPERHPALHDPGRKTSGSRGLVLGLYRKIRADQGDGEEQGRHDGCCRKGQDQPQPKGEHPLQEGRADLRIGFLRGSWRYLMERVGWTMTARAGVDRDVTAWPERGRRGWTGGVKGKGRSGPVGYGSLKIGGGGGGGDACAVVGGGRRPRQRSSRRLSPPAGALFPVRAVARRTPNDCLPLDGSNS